MIDLVGELRSKIPERIVRQGGQVDDGVEPLEICELDVANILSDMRHLRDIAARGEGAAFIEIAVEADYLMARPQQHGNHNGSDIA